MESKYIQEPYELFQPVLLSPSLLTLSASLQESPSFLLAEPAFITQPPQVIEAISVPQLFIFTTPIFCISDLDWIDLQLKNHLHLDARNFHNLRTYHLPIYYVPLLILRILRILQSLLPFRILPIPARLPLCCPFYPFLAQKSSCHRIPYD